MCSNILSKYSNLEPLRLHAIFGFPSNIASPKRLAAGYSAESAARSVFFSREQIDMLWQYAQYPSYISGTCCAGAALESANMDLPIKRPQKGVLGLALLRVSALKRIRKREKNCSVFSFP